MPLPHPYGYSRESFDANYAELSRHHPRANALAAAYRISRNAWRKECGQKPFPAYLRFPHGHLAPREIPKGRAHGFVRVQTGHLVRYVGTRASMAGLEGRVVAITDPTYAGGPRRATIKWAVHERAIGQRGVNAYLQPTEEPVDDLKPIRKLSKGFLFHNYRPHTMAR